MKKSREQAIKDLTLMLMYLNRFEDNNEFSRFQEPSWKGYDFNTLEELEKSELLFQPNKSKIAYLSEEGKNQAKKLLDEYNIADKELLERYEFREIKPDEVGQVVEIENICFPPHEACTAEQMKSRVELVPELFMVAVDKETGKLVAFLNGIGTNEFEFKDAFFEDATLHNPDGRNVMLCGLDVLPEHRNQGLAKELMYQYLRKEHGRGREMVILTCHKARIKMYRKMGFSDRGISKSTWGNETWYEMMIRVGWGN